MRESGREDKDNGNWVQFDPAYFSDSFSSLSLLFLSFFFSIFHERRLGLSGHKIKLSNSHTELLISGFLLGTVTSSALLYPCILHQNVRKNGREAPDISPHHDGEQFRRLDEHVQFTLKHLQPLIATDYACVISSGINVLFKIRKLAAEIFEHPAIHIRVKNRCIITDQGLS